MSSDKDGRSRCNTEHNGREEQRLVSEEPDGIVLYERNWEENSFSCEQVFPDGYADGQTETNDEIYEEAHEAGYDDGYKAGFLTALPSSNQYL